MPTYEYQCNTCGNRFEKYQSFSDEPVKICPECGNEVRKVFSAAGVIFKGSGWYINDSRKSSSRGKNEEKTETVSGESKSEVKAEAGSESKSEVKAEAGGSESKSEPKETKAASTGSESKPDAKPASGGKTEAA